MAAARLQLPRRELLSVNDEAVHGVPSPRRLHEGDLVKLGVTAELDGYYADACVTVPVGGLLLRGSASWPQRAGRETRPSLPPVLACL
jgi:hypothetical protein